MIEDTGGTSKLFSACKKQGASGSLYLEQQPENVYHLSMECLREDENLDRCNCTYEFCERKGMCCECVAYHRRKQQLPACYFPEDEERTFDRSIRRFLEINR